MTDPYAHPSAPALPPYPGPPLPLPRSRRRLVIGLVAGGVALLLLTVAGVGYAVSAALGSLAGDADLEGWEYAGTAHEQLPVRLPELTAFVEEWGGAKFTAVPAVEVLDDSAFEEAYLEPSDGQPRMDKGDWFATGEALGLIRDDEEFEEAQEPGASGVAGFYDPTTDRLVVRGESWSPWVEGTVVHELVHALQDQVADLDALTRATSVDDESYLALSTLVEGQATLVEEQWVMAQDTEYQDLYWMGMDEQYAGDSGEAPFDPLTDVLNTLPYDLGYVAVADLQLRDGIQGTVAALRQPPRTLEQAADLQGWARGEHHLADPITVERPEVPDGAEVVDTGELGSFLLTLLGLAEDEWYWAFEEGVVSGWAGDRFVTWTDGPQTCTRVDVAVDDDEAGSALVAHLAPFAADGGSVSERGGTVRLERCAG